MKFRFIFLFLLSSINFVFGQTNNHGTIKWGIIGNSLDSLAAIDQKSQAIKDKFDIVEGMKDLFQRKIIFKGQDSICIYSKNPLFDVESRSVLLHNKTYSFSNFDDIKFYTFGENLDSVKLLAHEINADLKFIKDTTHLEMINGFKTYKTTIANKINKDTIIAYCSKDIKINPLCNFNSILGLWSSFFMFNLEDSPVQIEQFIEGTKIKYGIQSYSNEIDSSFNLNIDTTNYSKFEEVETVIQNKIFSKKQAIFSGKGKNLDLLITLFKKYKLDTSLILEPIQMNQSFDSLKLVLAFCEKYISANSADNILSCLNNLITILKNENLIAQSSYEILKSNNLEESYDKDETFITLLKKLELKNLLAKIEVKERILQNLNESKLKLKNGKPIIEAQDFLSGGWDFSDLLFNIEGVEPIIIDTAYSSITSLIASIENLLKATFSKSTNLEIKVTYEKNNNDIIIKAGNYNYYYKNGNDGADDNYSLFSNIFRVYQTKFGRVVESKDTLSIGNFYNVMFPSLINQIMVDNNLDLIVYRINLNELFSINSLNDKIFNNTDFVYVSKEGNNNLTCNFSLENFNKDDPDPNCMVVAINEKNAIGGNTRKETHIPTITKNEVYKYIVDNKQRFNFSDSELADFQRKNILKIQNKVSELLDYQNKFELSKSIIDYPNIKSTNYLSTFSDLNKFLKGDFKPKNFSYNNEPEQEEILLKFTYKDQKVNISSSHSDFTNKFLVEINKYFILNNINENRIYYHSDSGIIYDKSYFYLSPTEKENFEKILHIEFELLTE